MAAETPSVGTPSDELAVVDAAPFQLTTPVLTSGTHTMVTITKGDGEKTSIDEQEVVVTLPHGLTDQTNFLPTRQVIIVFCGLSVALACAFLDQTMYASLLALRMLLLSCQLPASLPPCLESPLIFMPAATAHGLPPLIC